MMTLHNVTARVYSGGTPSADASPTQDGASPFAPVVSPGPVSWQMSTPVDEDGVADEAGLSSAYYEAVTSFDIESRDRCAKRCVLVRVAVEHHTFAVNVLSCQNAVQSLVLENTRHHAKESRLTRAHKTLAEFYPLTVVVVNALLPCDKGSYFRTSALV